MIEIQKILIWFRLHLLLWIFIFALLIRLFFSFVIFPLLEGPLILGTDPDRFGQLAMNWVDGKGYTFGGELEETTFRGPGYPLVIAGVYFIFGNIFPYMIFVQCLLGSLVCVVTYQIGRRVFNTYVGYIASILTALHPLLIWYSTRLRYEYLTTLLLVFGTFFWLRFIETKSLKDIILTGIFFGCFALTNQVIIFSPFLLIPGLLLRKPPRAKYLMRSTLLLLTMVAVISPWTFRNYMLSGRIIPVHSGGIYDFVKGFFEYEFHDEAPLQLSKIEHIAITHVSELLGIDPSQFNNTAEGVDQALYPYAISIIKNKPLELAKKILWMFPKFWYFSETTLRGWFLLIVEVPLLLLALIGTVHMLQTKRDGIPIMLIVLYFNSIYPVFHVEARYSTQVLPFVTILAAVGILHLLCLFGKKS
jgi:4-amino-4-deoxy-L-arabinose transferase-like glycosyltransferase